MTDVYHYVRCSTCKRALKWLNDEGIAHTPRCIVEDTPSAETLKSAIERSGLPLRRFFNTSGQAYREGGYRDKVAKMSIEDAANALAANGMLIKRPLVISDELVLVGFKEDAWAHAFNGKEDSPD